MSYVSTLWYYIGFLYLKTLIKKRGMFDLE